MPVYITQTVQKVDRQGRHRSPRWQSCQCRLPPRTAGCTASRHARLERPQGDTLVDVLERRYTVVARRSECLAAVVVLSGSGACRSLSLAGTQGASRQAFLRCLGWPSRQAPLAGALSSWLEYFVLEWLPGKLLLPGSCLLRSHGGSWRSPGKPCRGVPRLPVHEFGILGYPYSSTLTLLIQGLCEDIG